MIIKITQEDINKAKKAREKFHKHETWTYCRAESCPLAFALKRVFPAVRIWVSSCRISFNGKFIDLTLPIVNFIAETDKKQDRIRPRKLEIPIE